MRKRGWFLKRVSGEIAGLIPVSLWFFCGVGDWGVAIVRKEKR